MLDTIAELNAELPVVTLPAAIVLASLSKTQLMFFSELVECWNHKTGETTYIYESDSDVTVRKTAITLMARKGILKRVDDSDGMLTLMINPSILIPDDYTTAAEKYEEIGTKPIVVKCY